NLAAFFGVRSIEANNYRNSRFHSFESLDNSRGDQIAARNSPEDVHENGPYLGVRQDYFQRDGHRFRAGASTDVKKVRGCAPCLLDDVECRHHQARAVSDDSYRAVELDVL